jgi:acetylornithine deacetylase
MSNHPTSPAALLARLVAVNTVNVHFGGPADGEAQLIAVIESLARAWGLRTRRLPVDDSRCNLLVSHEVAPDAEWLLFESHLDTVSVDGMTVPPFELTAQGDRLHGRGACDTKGTGAAMLWALQEYARDPAARRNVGVLFVLDEEARMSGAQAFARQHLGEFKHLRGIIVGEPTGMRPLVAHNGALRWRSITRGVAAHSADPSRGRSAIRAMLEVVARLEERFVPLAKRDFPLTGRAAASINTIRGGNASNIIPDRCEITVDRRLVPGESADEILAQRDAALAGLAVEHDELYLAPPLPPGSSSALHAWLEPALRALGLDPAPTGAPYATDASHYAAAGAPVLVLGPGDIAQAHTKDEWLDRRELDRAAALYAAILRLP